MQKPLKDAQKCDLLKSLPVDEIGERTAPWSLVATAEQRAEIAKRLTIPAVNELSGVLNVRRESGDIFVDGVISARLTRECVVTLEPMEENVEDRFSLRFTSNIERLDDDELDDDDFVIEQLDGEKIDLGEILVQQLSLAMAAHPRKADAASLIDKYAPDKPLSPFSVLKGLAGDSDDREPTSE